VNCCVINRMASDQQIQRNEGDPCEEDIAPWLEARTSTSIGEVVSVRHQHRAHSIGHPQQMAAAGLSGVERLRFRYRSTRSRRMRSPAFIASCL
jgi:hypothetical protein